MILRMSKLFPVFHLKERNQSTLICLNTILPILSTLSCVKIVSFLSSPKWASFMYQFLWSIWKVNDHHCFFCFSALTRPLWVNMDLTDPGIWLISRGGPPVDICNCMFWEEKWVLVKSPGGGVRSSKLNMVEQSTFDICVWLKISQNCRFGNFTKTYGNLTTFAVTFPMNLSLPGSTGFSRSQRSPHFSFKALSFNNSGFSVVGFAESCPTSFPLLITQVSPRTGFGSKLCSF